MKNSIIFKGFTCVLITVTFLFSSCKQENVDVNSTSGLEQFGYEFYRDFKVTDLKGNEANIKLWANQDAILEGLTNENFELITTTKKFDAPNVSENQKSQTILKKFEQQNSLFLDVVSHKFNSDVTGFRVVIKDNNNLSLRWDLETIGLGANGVRGCAYQNLGFCQHEVDLDKKTSASNWFWQDLASAVLPNQFDWFVYCGSTGWSRFRFRMEFNCTSFNFDFFWLLQGQC